MVSQTGAGQGSQSQGQSYPAPVVLDADTLRTKYLFGIPLEDPESGESLDDEFLQFHIANATEWLERELNIHIARRTISDEQHDYIINEYQAFAFIQLNHFPILEVTKLSAKYPTDTVLFEFPLDWVKTVPVHGQVQIVPNVGTISQVILGRGGTYLPLIYNQLQMLPNLWHVDYVSGFENGKIPRDILDVIAKKAAIDVLHPIGELLRGLGIASESLGIDGLSQSISTTKSQGNIFAFRMGQYNAELYGDGKNPGQLNSLKKYWKGIKFQAI